ncbi:hypothetical protein [Ligilactobacillus ruminis]|uniref:hypothetical protein n=1 Tax=Ligilactobacillus ruminis TaxID=1623 RepID=UPI003F986C24
MDRNANKVVLVTQKSRMQELLYKYNTKAQAQFHIEHMGADFYDYVVEDENYQKSLAIVKQIADKYAKVTVVDREFVPNMLFGKDDVVIAVGRDGLVCNTMKYLNGQKLIGVNPNPARWDGVLLPFEAGDMENTIPKTITGDCDVKNVTMAKAVTNDGQEMLAVNDFFIGPKSHTSVRYDLTTGPVFGRVITESQSSSGIIVSTGIGQTGWYKSVMAQAKAACGLFGYDDSGDYEKIGWDEKKLSFVVREPFPSNTTDASIVFGTLEERDQFLVLSKMPENGVIFSDGMEADAIEFNSGVEVSIEVSETKGCLVR